jgi:hypothetical protein
MNSPVPFQWKYSFLVQFVQVGGQILWQIIVIHVDERIEWCEMTKSGNKHTGELKFKTADDVTAVSVLFTRSNIVPVEQQLFEFKLFCRRTCDWCASFGCD